jgi:quinol monooxygenase YgiN
MPNKPKEIAMSVTVILTLRAKDDMFETLEGTMKAILPDTAARDGAELISAASDPETKTCVVYEVWDKIESQQAYMAWRTERGDIDKLVSLLREPPHLDVMTHIF